jgi:transposase
MRPKGPPVMFEHRRFQAITLLRDGIAPIEVANRLGVDLRSIRRWRASYARFGPAGLASRPVPGRPRKLDAAGCARLDAILLQGARAHGFLTNSWTCSRIAAIILHMFGIRYHADHIGRLLRALGWIHQVPARRVSTRDAARCGHWVKKSPTPIDMPSSD